MKSFKNKNECGSSWSRVWLAAWLAVAALLVGRSLWLPGESPRRIASASPVADAELTRVSLEAPITKLTHAFQPIERLRVGMRVVSDNPETDTPEPTAVDPVTWRLVKLYAEQRWPDGTLDTIHIETLQPPAWLELFEAKVGSQVPPPLDLVEMGLPEDLETTVVVIEPCPRLESGPGRVVLTTVNHLNNDVWELSAENALGAREKLRPTGSHKFYSETRRTWVSTKEIHDNEVIRGRAGPLTIVAREQLPGTQRVYNLTVEGEHVYYVCELGLLAHNTCGPAEILQTQRELSLLANKQADVVRRFLKSSDTDLAKAYRSYQSTDPNFASLIEGRVFDRRLNRLLSRRFAGTGVRLDRTVPNSGSGLRPDVLFPSLGGKSVIFEFGGVSKLDGINKYSGLADELVPIVPLNRF